MMSFSKSLKIALHTLKDRFGLCFYSRPKKYHVVYHVNLRNGKKAETRVKLITPVPFDAAYQKISNLRFSVDPDIKKNYAVWKIHLLPGQEKEVKMTFNAEILPRRRSEKSEPDSKALKPNNFIQSDSKEIKEIAQKLTAGTQNTFEKIRILNNYVIATLKYGNPIPGLYKSDDALKNECVDCGGYNTLLIALLRSIGIPARNVSGFWLGYQNMKNAMHAWMEAMLPDGRWIALDPSTEQLFRQGRMWASGRLGYTGSDRVAMSVGEDIIIDAGDEKINLDILQNPVVHPADQVTVDFKFESNT